MGLGAEHKFAAAIGLGWADSVAGCETAGEECCDAAADRGRPACSGTRRARDVDDLARDITRGDEISSEEQLGALAAETVAVFIALAEGE